MLDDCIPPCGGFLPVFIEPGGYVMRVPVEEDHFSFNQCVHRETRDLHELSCTLPSLTEAKNCLPPSDERRVHAILQLTPDGGGAALWAKPGEEDEVASRRDKWKGCYGSWPIHTLSI